MTWGQILHDAEHQGRVKKDVKEILKYLLLLAFEILS